MVTNSALEVLAVVLSTLGEIGRRRQQSPLAIEMYEPLEGVIPIIK